MNKLLLGLCTIMSFVGQSADLPRKPDWQKWDNDIFKRAQKDKRLVLLDLEAVWCHWCHVMDQNTYSNLEVLSLLRSKFIAVKVDQDSRPDLSNRYEEWGWPATIIFDWNGNELAKRSGNIPPEQMVGILKAFISDPTPGPSILAVEKLTEASSPFLAADLKNELEKDHVQLEDKKYGGWGSLHKFMQLHPLEWALYKSAKGDAAQKATAKTALDRGIKLIDPVWGGAYQYSAGNGSWDEPHFEKIAQTQRNNLVGYSYAYAYFKDKNYLNAANDVKRYLKNFLTSPEGAFYTSQDADAVPGQHSAEYFNLSDSERKKRGIPRVDKNIYSRENGWLIEGLATLSEVSGDSEALAAAVKAANWIGKNRANGKDGFKHSAKDAYGPYLADNLSMLTATIELYRATADRKWLANAEKIAKYINKTFVQKGTPGFVTALGDGTKLGAKALRDENVDLARSANLLYRYSTNETYKTMAEKAMRFLANKKIASQHPTSSLLLADKELSSDPLHLTVVGSKSDEQAKKLYASLLAYPTIYKRVEWIDAKEGPLPGQDVKYPELKTAAAFVCTGTRCSLPLTNAETLHSKIATLAK
jgi:uncharacterized protein YyaL (SSP411 family)